MALYTIIANYDDGNCVHQLKAADPQSALLEWAQNLFDRALPGIDADARGELVKGIQRDDEDGIKAERSEVLINTWSAFPVVKDRPLYIRIVKTSKKDTAANAVTA